MKAMFVAALAIVLASCNQPTPTIQPKPTATNFLSGKPTLTPVTIELPKPQAATPPVRRSVFVPHAMFQELPANAESAGFPPLPVETPDSRTRPATKRVNAIVWDLGSGSFYTSEVAAGNLTSGWSGPGYLGTTIENARMVMICASGCNQWPVPVYENIEVSSFPAKASAMYEQPWWAEKREAGSGLHDALVLDVTTGDRYAYRFPREFRNSLGTGWFFGPVRAESGTRVVGICFDRCNEKP